jgi:hypothetical protein
MLRVGESAPICDIADTDGRIREKLTSALEPASHEIAAWRLPRAVAEQSRQVGDGQIHRACQFVQADILGEVGLEIVDGTPETPIMRIWCAFRGEGRRPGEVRMAAQQTDCQRVPEATAVLSTASRSTMV